MQHKIYIFVGHFNLSLVKKDILVIFHYEYPWDVYVVYKEGISIYAVAACME